MTQLEQLPINFNAEMAKAIANDTDTISHEVYEQMLKSIWWAARRGHTHQSMMELPLVVAEKVAYRLCDLKFVVDIIKDSYEDYSSDTQIATLEVSW